VEVVGKRRSRLMIKAWAEKEEALTGFYHKIREEIEKRVDVRPFVDGQVTHYNISTTNINDSVIQRSNIGNGKNRCPGCGYETKAGEKFCINCGERLE
ncbi:MAG: zinc ribbon domain-containing protein, partial [Methanosarcinaceae archaeon]|nr:zinc ribbon domain-containing protein [Methanosarcinaceae archaeon]